jgi:4-hydroxy-tetrahydrodipicolinate synthase
MASVMSKSTLKGVIAAIATPVDAHNAPDRARFMKLAKHLLDNGCDGLNVLGTTGEATSFTLEQRMGMMSALASSNLPLQRMMVGTGAAATGDAVRLTRHAAELGFSGALVLPPFYYKGVSNDGVVRYLDAVVRSSNALPIYLYNFPALSGVPYTIELLTRILKEFGNRIAGVKDSSGDMPYARKAATLSPEFDVFPSSEAVLLEARSGTFAGCISATANLNSEYCARAFKLGDESAHKTAVAIRSLFDGLALVPGIKALLAHQHGDKELASVAPPLSQFDEADLKSIQPRFDELRRTSEGMQRP